MSMQLHPRDAVHAAVVVEKLGQGATVPRPLNLATYAERLQVDLVPRNVFEEQQPDDAVPVFKDIPTVRRIDALSEVVVVDGRMDKRLSAVNFFSAMR